MKFRSVFRIFVALIVLSAIAFAQDEGPGNDAKKPFNSGNQLYKQGQTDAALAKYQEAVAAYPGFAVAHYWIGNCYRKKKDLVNATKAYQTAIEKDKKLIKAYTALGYVQELQRKFNDATNTYQAAIQIDPDGKDKYTRKAHYGLGEVNRKQERFSQAISHYQQAVQLDPGYGNALKGLGVSYLETGEYESAVSAFEAATSVLRRKKDKADVFYRMGDAYRQMKRYDEAITAYTNCLKSARKSVVKGGANFGLGEAYKNKRNSSKALEHYRLAAKDRSWKQSAEYEIDLLQNPDKYTN